jgi:hypothetical protein
MFDVNITYFEVSPEIVIDSKRGYLVKLSYNLDIADELDAIGPLARYCDFVENITFRIEWKRYIDGEYVLLKDRELPVYPIRRFRLGKENRRSAKCFLSKDFLKVEPNFIEAGELSCRISLHPILAYSRKTLDYSHGTLHASREGNSADFDQASTNRGYEY